MDDIKFVDRVKKYFGFLEFEYGFQITRESNSDIRPQTDGIVEYASTTIIVVIDSETGYAGMWFYRPKDSKKYDLDPIAIYEYLNTSDKEKELLLSTEPKDQPAALDLFNRKFLLNQSGWKVDNSTEDKLEIRLQNYADWLKAHANLCLEENLSWWAKLYEYKVNRARADHLRRGKSELGYAEVKDTDGNWKLIKQSIFKDKLEHVERLKKEFPS